MLPAMHSGWGWAGTAREFLESPFEAWAAALTEHYQRVMRLHPAETQLFAWRESHAVVTTALQNCRLAREEALDWGVVFEYELPFEGGRRPDVVVLTGGSIAVLEFKTAGAPLPADVDQVHRYARDLAEYHEGSHGREVTPVLVLTLPPGGAAKVGEIVVTNPDELAPYLLDGARPGTIDFRAWLESSYAPLPTLVAAARRIFEHEPLPHIRRARAARIPETVELISDLIRRAEEDSARLLVLLTGVPGSGKTLVGLRVVYERRGEGADATFLSGNGPLVEVLRDALKSGIFVRDLHKFVREYGIREKPPVHHIVVFDEAQRAWDRGQMSRKWGIERSEPDILVGIGERMTGWSGLVGLVGDGQEIHVGEEAGIGQWREAVEGASEDWRVHCAPRLEADFDGVSVSVHEDLDLDVSLRSRLAEQIHRWVACLLQGSPELAAREALKIHAGGFPMYLTRDLEEAKAYARRTYEGEEEKRYGLLASSQAKSLPAWGVENGFMATKNMKIAKWFNAPPDDPLSCCALTQPATEFQCQGLELDLPIICWGEDYLWSGTEWELHPKRSRIPKRDPEQLLQNTYRVLLTRGRDGLVIFLPPDEQFATTEHVLLAAGVKPLIEFEAELEELAEANGNGA